MAQAQLLYSFCWSSTQHKLRTFRTSKRLCLSPFLLKYLVCHWRNFFSIQCHLSQSGRSNFSEDTQQTGNLPTDSPVSVACSFWWCMDKVFSPSTEYWLSYGWRLGMQLLLGEIHTYIHSINSQSWRISHSSDGVLLQQFSQWSFKKAKWPYR